MEGQCYTAKKDVSNINCGGHSLNSEKPGERFYVHVNAGSEQSAIQGNELVHFTATVSKEIKNPLSSCDGEFINIPSTVDNAVMSELSWNNGSTSNKMASTAQASIPSR
jgi:hypothetical protein